MKTSSHIHRTGTGRAGAFALGAAVSLGALLATQPAAAGDLEGLALDWGKLAGALKALDPDRLPMTRGSPQPRDASAPVPWIGAEPRLSLVARDWAGSRRLVGDLALTDELRPSRSSRMVISRVRLARGLLAPFAQLGLGEWRVDTTLFPTLPRERALAAQAELGFELALGRGTVMAFETGWTFLRSGDPSDVVARTYPALFSSCVAVRSRF